MRRRSRSGSIISMMDRCAEYDITDKIAGHVPLRMG
jgi:hypothetical protein